MDDSHRQFAYRVPWLGLATTGTAATVAIGIGISRGVTGYPMAPKMAGLLSAIALTALGVALWGAAMWAAVRWLRHPKNISVSERAVSLCRSRLSPSHVSVPWESITALRTAEIDDHRQIELVWLDGSAVVSNSMLRDPEAFDALSALLSQRLARLGVPVENCTAAERSRRRRPQFTIAWMMMAVTFIAAVLGMYSFVYGSYSWEVLLHLGITLAIVLGVPWLVVYAPRAARVFAIGFAVGFWVEWVAILTCGSLGWIASLPIGSGGWYPLTALLWRIGTAFPWASWLAPGVTACVIGSLASGALVGIATSAVHHRIARNRRLPPRS